MGFRVSLVVAEESSGGNQNGPYSTTTTLTSQAVHCLFPIPGRQENTAGVAEYGIKHDHDYNGYDYHLYFCRRYMLHHHCLNDATHLQFCQNSCHPLQILAVGAFSAATVSAAPQLQSAHTVHGLGLRELIMTLMAKIRQPRC